MLPGRPLHIQLEGAAATLCCAIKPLNSFLEPEEREREDIVLSELNQCRSGVNPTLQSEEARRQRNHEAVTDYPIWFE